MPVSLAGDVFHQPVFCIFTYLLKFKTSEQVTPVIFPLLKLQKLAWLITMEQLLEMTLWTGKKNTGETAYLPRSGEIIPSTPSFKISSEVNYTEPLRWLHGNQPSWGPTEWQAEHHPRRILATITFDTAAALGAVSTWNWFFFLLEVGKEKKWNMAIGGRQYW